jgi:ketosteroid isomerase-like protein
MAVRENFVDARSAARRWARTWAEAWPVRDVESIVALQAESGDHWASLFRPFRGRAGLRGYVAECFAEETNPAKTWFAEPQVDGDSAAVEYWVVMHTKDGPATICGCTMVRFDEAGLVIEARDYSHLKEGDHEPPPAGVKWRWTSS